MDFICSVQLKLLMKLIGMLAIPVHCYSIVLSRYLHFAKSRLFRKFVYSQRVRVHSSYVQFFLRQVENGLNPVVQHYISLTGRRLPLRMLKRQSPLSVFLRTHFTRTIKFHPSFFVQIPSFFSFSFFGEFSAKQKLKIISIGNHTVSSSIWN